MMGRKRQRLAAELFVPNVAVLLPTSNLVSRWAGDNATALVATDSVGSRNLTFQNGTVVVAGVGGHQAIYMDGINDDMVSGGSNIVSSYFTSVALVKIPSGGSAGFMQGYVYWNIQFKVSETQMRGSIVQLSPAAAFTTPTVTFEEPITDQWVAIWCRFRAGYFEIGMNDVTPLGSIATPFSAIRSDTGGWRVGQTNYFSILGADGFCNHFRQDEALYNAALSDADLQQAIDFMLAQAA